MGGTRKSLSGNGVDRCSASESQCNQQTDKARNQSMRGDGVKEERRLFARINNHAKP
jgi:hypothetical protein